MTNPDDIDLYLNDLDQLILKHLQDGRCTPTLLQRLIADKENEEYTSQYINQRLTRLREHGIITNLYDSGVYELTDDA